MSGVSFAARSGTLEAMNFHFAVLAVATVGCAYRTPDVHVPASVADVSGRRDATDITVRGADEAETRDVETDVRDLLGDVGGVVPFGIPLS